MSSTIVLRNLGTGKELKIVNPFIQVQFENQNFEVKTVNRPEELWQVLRLRYDVFFREFSSKKSFSFFPLDFDSHDILCDHLVVKDKSTKKIVAAYRLLSSRRKPLERAYYSEGEFYLHDFLSKPGIKLELGRACVHRDYRSGEVVSLLWKGLLEYSRMNGSDYLFGCSSIPGKDFLALSQIMNSLRDKGALIEGMEISPREKFKPTQDFSLVQDPAAPKGLSSLMNMYLLAGAKFSESMAYDGEMDCLDLFTVMKVSDLPKSFVRKFSL